MHLFVTVRNKICVCIGISSLLAGSLGLESLPFQRQSCREFPQAFQKNDAIAHNKRENVCVSSAGVMPESLHPEHFSDNHTVQTTVTTSLFLFTALKSVAECYFCYYCILCFYKYFVYLLNPKILDLKIIA